LVNWADIPTLVVAADGRLLAQWLVLLGEAGYGSKLSTSADGGSTWTEPVFLHEDRGEAEHGFFRLLPLPTGPTLALWLDGRGYLTGADQTAVMARIIGSDGSLGAEQMPDERSCDCCPLDAAIDATGQVLVVYRDRSPQEIRDVSVSRFDGEGWSEPQRVHEDGWTIAGCPVNGPAIDSAGNTVAIAWFSAPDGAGRVQAKISTDGGANFQGPILLDEGPIAGRVDVLAQEGGGALVVWMGRRGEETVLLLQQLRADGATGARQVIAPVSGSRKSGFPRLAASADGPMVAWTEVTEDSTRVRTARVRFE
jgi:hypothetical protein